MNVAFTVPHHTDENQEADYFIATGTREEWEEILGNVDGIGHSPALLSLISELKRWGMNKRYGCCS